MPRTTSVNSYKHYQPLPADQQAQLAEALQDEGVLTQKMDGVVAILQKANELPTNEEGEVELDLRWEFAAGLLAAAMADWMAGF